MSGPHPDPLTDMLSGPHELDGKFESEAKAVTTCISDAALTSIAVSLKRIADAFDGGIDDDERAEWEAKPFVAIEAERRTVMRAHDLFEMRPANARLIAVAPELLDLVLQYRNDLWYPPSPDSIDRRLDAIARVVDKVLG